MVVMADDVADFGDEVRSCPQFRQNLAGNGRSFFFLIAGGGAVVLALRLLDADIMKVCGGEDHGGVSPFRFDDLFGVAGHLGGMGDAPEVAPEGAFHLNRNPVL
jgi:hypothetical protein